MSKERAKRRTARGHEAAIRTAARAAEADRRERREARKKARKKTLGRVTTGRFPTRVPTGRQTGVLARRRRTQTWLLLVSLLAVQIFVWVVRPDWPARLAALVISILAAPALAGLLFRRR